MKIVNNLLVGLLCIACFSGANTPEELLKDYVETVTSGNATRDFYAEKTAGDLLKDIEAMSEEDFQEYNNFSRIKYAKVKVLSKSCSDDNCTLTYVVKYNVFVENKPSYETEVKKIAELVRIDNNWKISAVKNRKTFIDAKSAIDISNKK